MPRTARVGAARVPHFSCILTRRGLSDIGLSPDSRICYTQSVLRGPGAAPGLLEFTVTPGRSLPVTGTVSPGDGPRFFSEMFSFLISEHKNLRLWNVVRSCTPLPAVVFTHHPPLGPSRRSRDPAVADRAGERRSVDRRAERKQGWAEVCLMPRLGGEGRVGVPKPHGGAPVSEEAWGSCPRTDHAFPVA